MMIGKGNNKKSMAYVGNIVALIKDRLDKSEPGYHVFNYADNPDFSMTELVKIIEKPKKFYSDLVVTGLYFYENDVLDLLKQGNQH